VLIISRKANVESYIRYQTKANDGKQYATFCPSDRRHGGKDIYLGIVIDAKEGIFYNRNSGYFRFTIEGGRVPLNSNEVQYAELTQKYDCMITRKPLILEFGDAWFLDHVMDKSGLKELFKNVLFKESDTLLSLIAFKLLDSNANSYAERWFTGSYAQYLYPKANLQSPRISEFMERLGKEETKRAFFDSYIPYLKGIPDVSENVLIDSTGLPNDTHFGYSEISNHNGVISKETRLIYVVERKSGLPVYFRYVAGNIVDVTTLRATINHLKAQSMDVNHGILDAGYCSEKNIHDLYDSKIPFLIRMPNNALAKNLFKDHGVDVYGAKYALEYGDRLLFMKRVSVKLYSYDCYAYIAIDFKRMTDEQEHYYRKAVKKRKKKEKDPEMEMSKDKFGYFVLISSEKLEISEVMPLYYMRQTIEQTFDFAKNDVALMPVRSHNDETFRGHLLLSFMATITLITVKRVLKTRKKLAIIPAVQALRSMRYIKCDVFPHSLVTSEPSKYANLIINELKLNIPGSLNL
jgi:transposase